MVKLADIVTEVFIIPFLVLLLPLKVALPLQLQATCVTQTLKT